MRKRSIAGSAMLAMALVLPAEAQVGQTHYNARPSVGSSIPQSYDAPIPSTIEMPRHRAEAPARVPQDGQRWMAMPPHGPELRQDHGQRWGGTIGGRWVAGVQAPGGWKAYRRLDRGDRVSRYWLAPGFVIGDFLAWGLAAPPYGYHWTRYYDDAVLVDDDGRVWDRVGGIAWEGESYSYADTYGAESHSESYASSGAGYSRPPLHGDSAGRAWGGSAPPVGYPTPAAPAPGGYAANGYSSYAYSSGGATVTVINIPGPTTTTTTTTERVVTSYATVAKKRTQRARRVVRASSCCVCGCR